MWAGKAGVSYITMRNGHIAYIRLARVNNTKLSAVHTAEHERTLPLLYLHEETASYVARPASLTLHQGAGGVQLSQCHGTRTATATAVPLGTAITTVVGGGWRFPRVRDRRHLRSTY